MKMGLFLRINNRRIVGLVFSTSSRPPPPAVSAAAEFWCSLGVLPAAHTIACRCFTLRQVDSVKFTLKWGALEVAVDWNETTVAGGTDASHLTAAQIKAMNVTALARAMVRKRLF